MKMLFKYIKNHQWLQFISDPNIRILVVLGLLYRFVLSVLYFNVTQVPDSWDFITLGDHLLRFDLSGYNGNRSPGYPLILFLSFGSQKIAVLYAFAFGITTSILWYKTLVNVGFKNQWALYISLFIESFIHNYFYESAIIVESLALFLFSVLVYLFSKGYLTRTDWKSNTILAILLGYLTLVKPFYAYIPFVIYGLSVLTQGFKAMVSPKLIPIVFTLLSYFGWSYVNYQNTGYFVSTSFFGLNLTQNCVYFAEKTTPEYQWIGDIYAKYRDRNLKANDTLPKLKKYNMAMTIWNAHDELMMHTNNNFPDLSNQLGAYAKATIAKNPGEYAYQVLARSWLDFWKTSMFWNYLDFCVPYANKVLLGIWLIQDVLLLILKFGFLLISPYYLYQFFITRKVTFPFVLSTLIWATSILQALVTYGENNRFSYPFEFMIIMVWAFYIKDKKLFFTYQKN